MGIGRLGLAAAIAAAAAVVPAAAAHADAPACTTTFTGAVSTAWELPGNWDGGVPTSTSVACWSDGQTVVVAAGSQTAWIVHGGELDVTGGTFTLADPPSDTYAWGSALTVFVQSGGTTSGYASSIYVADHAEWTGPSVVSLPMGGGSLSIDGTGPTELAGDFSVDWGSVTITNPDFVTSGSFHLRAHGVLTLGAFVVPHIGPGQGTFVATDEGGGQMQGPTSGDFGFAGDAYAGPVHVEPGSTFHAASITFGCGGPHGGSIACSTITGAGTVDTRHISGAFAGYPDPNAPAAYGNVGGDALAPGLGTLHLVGPVTLDGGLRIRPDATSDGQLGHVEVTGGPVTFTGVASVNPTPPGSWNPAAGQSFTVLLDADGVSSAGAGAYPTRAWRPTATATTFAVTAAASAASCAPPGAPQASKVDVRRGAHLRLTGQVVLACRDTVPYTRPPVPKRTRVDLTPRGKKAYLPGTLIGHLAVDPDQHVHGWVTIPKRTKPGRYAIHVYGASRVLAITVR